MPCACAAACDHDAALTTRRSLFGLAAGVAALAAATPTVARAAEPTAPAMTPDQALDLLKRGNSQFLSDAPYRAAIGRQRRIALARSQKPFAVLVSCSDSRVSPELLFGRGLGELFIIRNAGNTVDTVALGSIEYAVGVLGVPLIVVLGHERCGAVEAATKVVTDNARYPGSIGRMIEPIVPAALRARAAPGDYLDNAVNENVRRVVDGLKQSEPILLEPLRAGRLKIVGARYDLDDGAVNFDLA